MKRTPLIAGAVLLLAAGAGLWLQHLEGARHGRYLEATRYGAALEEGRRYGEASLVYEQAAALDLTGAERAELRFRLARVKILGNELTAALGVLRQLASEDVKRFHIDVGPLYLELGERALEAGLADLARLAFREGRGVAPARYEEFGRRLDAMLEQPPAAGGKRKDTP